MSEFLATIRDVIRQQAERAKRVAREGRYSPLKFLDKGDRLLKKSPAEVYLSRMAVDASSSIRSDVNDYLGAAIYSSPEALGGLEEDMRFVVDRSVISKLRKSLTTDNEAWGFIAHGKDLHLHQLITIKFLDPNMVGSLVTIARKQMQSPQEERVIPAKAGKKDFPEAFIYSFAQEIKRIANLQHPNFAKAYDVVWVEIDGQYLPGFVMEQLKQIRRLNTAEVIEMSKQVASALDYSHKLGVVHNDIKPSNIMQRSADAAPGSRFAVIDLGGSSRVGNRAVMTTPIFADPQQQVDSAGAPESDQHALAVTVYQLLGGDSRPFTQTKDTGRQDGVHVSAMQELKSLHRLFPNREAVMRVLNKATAWDRGERYPSCSDFAADLERALKGVSPILVSNTALYLPPTVAVNSSHIYK